MERDTFMQCLEVLSGVTISKQTATVEKGFRLSVHVGEPGRGVSISDIESIDLQDTFAVIRTATPDAGSYCTEYKHLSVAVSRDDKKSTRRTGFA